MSFYAPEVDIYKVYDSIAFDTVSKQASNTVLWPFKRVRGHLEVSARLGN